MITEISVEIHCLQPRWVDLENSRYRLYVNDDLLTERDWAWGQNTYINERIGADLPAGLSHTIRVEVVKSRPDALTQLGLNNLKVNDIPQTSWDGNRDSLSFTVA